MPSNDKLAAFLAEPRNVIVAGIRKDGRPHLTPNWFHWDGELFYVSTTRTRAKYAIFRRDPRASLAIDDPVGFRCMLVPGQVEIRENVADELGHFRAIREKHGVPGAQRLRAAHRAPGRAAGTARDTSRRAGEHLDDVG